MEITAYWCLLEVILLRILIEAAPTTIHANLTLQTSGNGDNRKYIMSAMGGINSTTPNGSMTSYAVTTPHHTGSVTVERDGIAVDQVDLLHKSGTQEAAKISNVPEIIAELSSVDIVTAIVDKGDSEVPSVTDLNKKMPTVTNFATIPVHTATLIDRNETMSHVEERNEALETVNVTKPNDNYAQSSKIDNIRINIMTSTDILNQSYTNESTDNPELKLLKEKESALTNHSRGEHSSTSQIKNELNDSMNVSAESHMQQNVNIDQSKIKEDLDRTATVKPIYEFIEHQTKSESNNLNDNNDAIEPNILNMYEEIYVTVSSKLSELNEATRLKDNETKTYSENTAYLGPPKLQQHMDELQENLDSMQGNLNEIYKILSKSDALDINGVSNDEASVSLSSHIGEEMSGSSSTHMDEEMSGSSSSYVDEEFSGVPGQMGSGDNSDFII